MQKVKVLTISLLVLPLLNFAQEGAPMTQHHDPNFTANLQKRRDAILKAMPAETMALIESEPPRQYSNDVFYEYRQENNLYYLTGINQENIALMLIKDKNGTRKILFLPEQIPSQELWTGHMMSVDEARKRSGITEIFPRQWLFTSRWQNPSFRMIHIDDIIHRLRAIKSDYEIKQLRFAAETTAMALLKAMKSTKPKLWEYQIEAAIEHEFKWSNCAVGFPSIVASGPNATTLHYEENQREMQSGDLLLMDVGAEYNHYTADITRTVPVNGRFTPEQRAIYNAVLKAQIAAESTLKPGVSLQDLQTKAMDVLGDELLALGLITQKHPQQIRLWFPHGIGHSIGLDVHDVGIAKIEPLQPNMFITIEPGLYIREDRLDNLPASFPDRENFIKSVTPAVQLYKGIGVRIEDDYLITPSGFERLSRNVPRDPDAIETYMQ